MKKTLLSLAVVSLLSADSTMCFKENWTDMSKIETIALAGGKCENKYSVSDMKAQGWRVDDIKISSSKEGMNYMYVFSKGTANNSNVFSGANADEISEEIYEKVEQRILAKQAKVEKKRKAKVVAKAKAVGKNIYKTTCAKCHGQNGEVSAYNTSKPLNTLSVEDIEIAFRDYSLTAKDNGMAMIMMPYVDKYSSSQIKNIATYIQTLK